ncbi:helix-turn-helix domain-containing protein [Rhodococcus sp. NPDC078407]|uniref:helix-turn-helix domain-containing protein n=1 Tax=Rhodococcus sp. NPDC078407 TaxID=3364509 RepID=UPI0037C8544C
MSILNELEKLDIVGQTLNLVRTAHNLTIEQVANVAGINPNDLRAIETQSVAASGDTLRNISEALSDLATADLTGSIRLHCHKCGSEAVTVNAPPPPVPVTCADCRHAPVEDVPVELDADIAAETTHHTAAIPSGAHTLTLDASTIEYTDGIAETSFHIARAFENVTVDLSSARLLRDELSAAIAAAEAFPAHVETNTP